VLRLEIRQAGGFPDPDALTEATRVSTQDTLELTFRRAYENLSGRMARSRTGATARGLVSRVAVEGAAIVGALGNTEFTAHILEVGATAIPVLRPRGARRGRGRRRRGPRVLAIPIGGGRVIFRMFASIPARAPIPWASSALRDTTPEAEAIFEAELGKVLEEPGRGPIRILTTEPARGA
jgi:hypothetical protein